MNMPGFTAEDALYGASSRHYETTRRNVLADNQPPSGTVVPQLVYAFPSADGEGICIGVEDYIMGYSYVVGCFY
jgi:hypothetical protein